MTHLVTAAYRTDTEINLPDCFHQFSHGHTSVTASKSLPSLNTEDHFQVFRSHPVIQEAVITDLLKSGREDMHEKTPDKLLILQLYHASRVSPLFCSRGKRDIHFVYIEKAAVGDRDFVRVTSEILDRIAKSIECFFDKRTPVFFIELIAEIIPLIGVAKF